MSQRPIDKLCDSLQAEFDGESRGQCISTLLRDYQADHRDWDDWAMWSDERYTRNLVHLGDSFELLILCWNPGQQSPIHDHAGQNCWMAVLEGQLEEIHYVDPDNKDRVAEAPLEKGRVNSFAEGGVTFIEDSIAYHLTRPPGSVRAVSMHLYAKPIDTCRVFCPDTGLAESVALGYHSVRGELVGSASAEEIRSRFHPVPRGDYAL